LKRVLHIQIVQEFLFMEDSQVRLMLAEELNQRYGSSGKGLERGFRFWRKKYAETVIVDGALLLKRIIDILAANTLLILLSPLFLFITLMSKLTARESVFFRQSRIGLWGKEIPFPMIEPIPVDAKCARKYTRGVWQYKKVQGYTSSDVGSSDVPVRFFCTPEITIIELRRPEKTL
jgi:hypothetical protein